MLPHLSKYLKTVPQQLPFTPIFAKCGGKVAGLGCVEIEYFAMGYLRGDLIR
jgi:hypothetical protein